MMARTFSAQMGGIVLGLLMLGGTVSTTSAQTPLPHGFEIRLLPGYTHEQLRGIDSTVGKIGKKDGLQIQYTMGRIPQMGERTFGGSYVNAALRFPEKDRLWLKQQTTGGRKVYVAYSKEHLLLVSSTSTTEGVNFLATAKTSEEVADVLMMVLTLAERKPKSDK
jgi:hypothetical protein